MDTQHAQQLVELLDTVRTTMQEQVVFNVETVRVNRTQRAIPSLI